MKLVIFFLTGLLLIPGHAYNKGVADWPQYETRMSSTQKDDPRLAGPLRQKAEQYDVWNAAHHFPYYGGNAGVRFADESYERATEYTSLYDSCIWTGVYLGTQALRYNLTGSQAALDNARRALQALDGYLHVTYTRGYIARYWAPQNSLPYKNDSVCKLNPRCHKVTSGKYAGDFWFGATTKDQYTGWFFGLSLAYSYISDPQMRAVIRADVTEVVDQLMKDAWIIKDQKGEYLYFSAAQRPTYLFQVSWLSIAYDMTGDKKYKDALNERLGSFTIWYNGLMFIPQKLNVYYQYYAHNLDITTWFNLLRLGKLYFPKEAYEQLRTVFTTRTHGLVKLTHNAWFNVIFMAQGNYKPGTKKDPYKAQLLQDLQDFRPAPKHSYYLPARDKKTYKLDPATSWVKYFPYLRTWFASNVKMSFNLQAKKAFPISQQCFSDFIFQRSPFQVAACGTESKLYVEPGTDYLAAYWMAVFYKFIALSE